MTGTDDVARAANERRSLDVVSGSAQCVRHRNQTCFAPLLFPTPGFMSLQRASAFPAALNGGGYA